MNNSIVSAIAIASAMAFAPALMAQVTPAPTPGQPIPGQVNPQIPGQNNVPGQLNNNQTPGNTPMNQTGQRVSEAQIRNTLQGQGYTQIDRVELKGSDYDVQAKKGNQSFNILVDAATGQVKSANPG